MSAEVVSTPPERLRPRRKPSRLPNALRAAVYDKNKRVCWGALQTRKDTIRTLRPSSSTSGHMSILTLCYTTIAPGISMFTRCAAFPVE